MSQLILTKFEQAFTMKPKIDFYILRDENFLQSFTFTCQLVEKLYDQGNSICIETESPKAAEQFDQALWSFRANSFIPHEASGKEIKVAGLKNLKTTPIIRINLQIPVQPEPIRCERLLQIVPNAPNLLQLARQNYRYYQQQNYIIASHQIK